MVRYKWLQAYLPLDIKELAQRMLDNEFADARQEGFIISKSTNTELSGKYVEKIIKKEMVEDPFGFAIETESIDFYTCRFLIQANSKFIRIVTPPRSLRKFINALREITGFGLIVSEPSVDPQSWLRALTKVVDNLELVNIRSSGIKASDYASAKLEISGSRDVTEAYRIMLDGKRHTVDSLKFIGDKDGYKFSGEIGKRANLKLNGKGSPELLQLLSKQLDFLFKHEK